MGKGGIVELTPFFQFTTQRLSYQNHRLSLDTTFLHPLGNIYKLTCNESLIRPTYPVGNHHGGVVRVALFQFSHHLTYLGHA